MENLKDEKEVAQAVLDKAKKMLDEYLQKKESDKYQEQTYGGKIKGINKPNGPDVQNDRARNKGVGTSEAGDWAKETHGGEKGVYVDEAKAKHREVLKEMKDMPKPKLPDDSKLKKSEKLRSFLAKKSQKRLAKCGEQKKV